MLNRSNTCSRMDSQQLKGVAKSNEQNNGKTVGKSKLVPPDGGWGWLVLFGATLVNFLIPGMIKSFGVLFVEFLEVFGSTPAKAAWIPSVCYFLYSSLGPVSSVLSFKYSYRAVTVAGGTFASTGMILSYFANSVTYLYISFGVLVGIGAGLSFPPTVYIVTSYFVRFRGLANGICISGSALGSIILPPVLRALLNTYGYRGSILIMGGITLHVWVAALFYDPVEMHMKRVHCDEENNDGSIDDDGDVDKNNEDSDNAQNQCSEPLKLLKLPELNLNNSMNSLTHVYNYSEYSLMLDSTLDTSVVNDLSKQRNAITAENSCAATNNIIPGDRTRLVHTKSASTNSFQYITAAYHGSTLTLKPFTSSFSLKSIYKPHNKPEKSGAKKSLSVPQIKMKFFDLSLLSNPLYLIILLSNASNAIGYTNFIILLPSYAQQLGYEKTTGALLLSIVSTFDLVGRIGGSALSDLHVCPKIAYFVGGLLVSGSCLVTLPLCAGLLEVATCCSIFGLASGVYVGVTAVIMTDMLGEERLQITYGVSLFVNGLLQLIGPPLCGLGFQLMHSYVYLFATLGGILIFGAIIWIFVPFIKTKPPLNDTSEIAE